MEVKVTLHGILRDFLPRKAKGKTTLNLPEGVTIQDVINDLKINRTVNSSVNGVQVELTHHLQDGDDLQIFRPIAGGSV